MIIVEGADNVGKSTLVRQLIEADPKLRILHRDRFNPKAKETIGTTHIRALLPEDSDRVAHTYSVADRFLASEEIYGNLYRGGSRFDEAERLTIRQLLVGYGAFVVWCDAPDDDVRKSWAEREQLYEKDPMEIVHAYRSQIRTVFEPFTILPYDYTSPNAERDRHRIIELNELISRSRRRRVGFWSAFPFGIGSIEGPRIIIVLDGEVSTETAVPFAISWEGRYLSTVIQRIEKSLNRNLARDLFITGTNKGTGRDAVLLREELSYLGTDRDTLIVTIGARAASYVSYCLPYFCETPRVASLPMPFVGTDQVIAETVERLATAIGSIYTLPLLQEFSREHHGLQSA